MATTASAVPPRDEQPGPQGSVRPDVHDEGDEGGNAEQRAWPEGRIDEEVVEADRAELLQQHRDPKDREAKEQEGEEGDAVIEGAVLAKGRDDPQGDADDDRENRRGGDEQDGLDHRSPEEVHHGIPLEVVPEVAAGDEGGGASERTAQPQEVPQIRGCLQVQLLGPPSHQDLTVGVPARAEVFEGISGVGREDIDEIRRGEEDDDRHRETSSGISQQAQLL